MRTSISMRRFTTFAIAVAVSGVVSIAGAQDAQFYELPSLGGAYSFPYDVSADGSTIVGDSENSAGAIEATVWTSDGRVTGLGSLGGTSSASGVSAYGTVIAGSSIDATGRPEAFLWTAETGMVGLGTLGGRSSAAAHYPCVSDDGSTVVGISDNVIGQQEGFVWTAATGMVGLGTLGGIRSSPNGVSADGTTVVGDSRNASDQTKAFVWTAEAGMQGLGTLGGIYSTAIGVSGDGSTVVGASNDGVGGRAFIWTAEIGMIALPQPTQNFTSAESISDDGTIIVGYSRDASGAFRGVVWRGAEREIIDVSTLMTDEYGIDLTGWNIDWVSAVSADNHTIIGSGTNPSGDYVGWALVLPWEPEVLLADLVMAVAAINTDHGISNQLDTKLDAALEAFTAENSIQRNDAVNKMNAFINAVEAQRGKKISDAEADSLVAAAREIIALIE